MRAFLVTFLLVQIWSCESLKVTRLVVQGELIQDNWVAKGTFVNNEDYEIRCYEDNGLDLAQVFHKDDLLATLAFDGPCYPVESITGNLGFKKDGRVTLVGTKMDNGFFTMTRLEGSGEVNVGSVPYVIVNELNIEQTQWKEKSK